MSRAPAAGARVRGARGQVPPSHLRRGSAEPGRSLLPGAGTPQTKGSRAPGAPPGFSSLLHNREPRFPPGPAARRPDPSPAALRAHLIPPTAAPLRSVPPGPSPRRRRRGGGREPPALFRKIRHFHPVTAARPPAPAAPAPGSRPLAPVRRGRRPSRRRAERGASPQLAAQSRGGPGLRPAAGCQRPAAPGRRSFPPAAAFPPLGTHRAGGSSAAAASSSSLRAALRCRARRRRRQCPRGAAAFVQNHAPRAVPPPHPIILRRGALATAGAALTPSRFPGLPVPPPHRAAALARRRRRSMVGEKMAAAVRQELAQLMNSSGSHKDLAGK